MEYPKPKYKIGDIVIAVYKYATQTDNNGNKKSLFKTKQTEIKWAELIYLEEENKFYWEYINADHVHYKEEEIKEKLN